MAEVQELVELVFIMAHETIQSLSLARVYQSLAFFLSFSLFSYLPLSLSLKCLHPLTQTLKAGRYKDRQIHHRFKQDLLELSLASYWSLYNLDLSLQQSEIAVEGCRAWQGQRWESYRPQKKDEKGESSRMKFRERSMGRFWQQDDRVETRELRGG